ncbi:MAG: HAMP domain-containing histidine kinase [Hyphomicrobiaceae bacterium]|nr:HAMP domain-containing histidine kinase [Hyphomicrobiaceae bacterium]
MSTIARRLPGLLASSAFRLTAAAAAAFIVLATALVTVVFSQANAVLTDQVMSTLSAEADALRTESRGGRAALVDAVAARSRPEGPGLYVLVDGTGRKLAGNLSRVPPEVPVEGSGSVFRYRPNVTGRGSGNLPPERLAVGTQLSMPDGDRLVVARDIEDQRRYAERVKLLVIGGFAALAFVGLMAAAVISRVVLRRIEAMNHAASRIMAGDFQQRVPVDGSGDELDGLAQNLNAMLERIVELMAGMREVSDNIAHDLKTPLNRLRNRVEGALREANPSLHREALERTIEEADELIRTFNALLLIARLEASAVDDSATTVDVGRLVAGVVEFYAPVAEEDGTRLELVPDLPSGAERGALVRANGQLLQQAVANLVDNALKYAVRASGRGTLEPVRVAVRADGSDVVITVSDRGPGIPAADRERALRRFVRLDASRTQPGTGLGLSLVAAVARLHGGRIILSDTAPGALEPGLKVELVLPLLAAPPPVRRDGTASQTANAVVADHLPKTEARPFAEKAGA